MFLSIVTILVALALGTMSPGPSFLMVARKAASSPRNEALMAALGLGSGAFVFAVAALLGLKAVFHALPLLYTALKVLGGAYLVYLGVRMWMASKHPLAPDATAAAGKQKNALLRAYLQGLFTQLSNPKTAIVFAGIFAALMPAHPPLVYYIVVATVATLVDATWYSFVVVMLSQPFPRAAYLRHKAIFDRLAGTLMIGLGVKLISMFRDAT
jgi:threonine/homoserine/homoserine lactone efflux protein